VDANTIIGDITAVTKKWTKQRKAEARRASAAARRPYLYCVRDTIKEAARDAMEAAYQKASSGGTLPAHARQIMYAARGPIQDRTGQPLDDKYFTQTLLPDYLNEHPEITAGWDVVFDARGHFREPHTGLEVPLGTLEVRQYLSGSRWEAPVTVRGLFPTGGPGDRFGAVLFVEKEGFLPLFHRVRLAERYDLAIMSTKGMSVVAARMLVDRLCGANGIPLLTLHDFDKAGFSILGTFRRNNRRYTFSHHIRVIDLGLRLADVEACGLESEAVSIKDSWKVRGTLRRNGAGQDEVDFLLEGRRAELNAFASRALVDWVEGKLKDHGVKKVVPADDVLADAYRRAFVRQSVRSAIPGLIEQARRRLEAAGVPDDLSGQVAAALAKKSAAPWDRVVARLARKVVRELREDAGR
jgi:hypothetical protein